MLAFPVKTNATAADQQIAPFADLKIVNFVQVSLQFVLNALKDLNTFQIMTNADQFHLDAKTSNFIWMSVIIAKQDS